MKDLGEANFTIVGLGLLGGSLGAALRKRKLGRRVWGMARKEATLQKALSLEAIDGGSTDLAEAVDGADVAILATPVRAIIEMLPRLGKHLAPGCILMDLGSTKRQVVQAMEDLPPHIQPIGGHPMAGKERSGIEALDAELFQGATFALTPLERTSIETIAFAERLALALGARPLLVSAERHDQMVAATSHIPYLASIALVRLAQERAVEDFALWELTAGGFRDMSRLSASSIEMCLDILLTNRGNILAGIEGLEGEMGRLKRALQSEDEAGLRRLLAEAREIRRARYP